ncbi:response regulator transcription factor [Streptomyces sp. NBC_00354]|uniref:response regulator transcription factor n=1 Tax=Streptomyces sp. NBC_00354 TaxID=2975723 RepID=UPI002E266FB5|nr:response regulator transcription factor [Streptomyces sp. NBC_01001]
MSRQMAGLPRRPGDTEHLSEALVSIEQGLRDLIESDRQIRVLIADPDPISRHVLASVLRGTCGLDVVDSLDSRQPPLQWPLNRVDVVVLAIGPREDPVPVIRELRGQDVPVLLMGTDWTRAGLRNALAAGAAGCLVKDTKLAGLGTAARAVAAGHTLIAPELRHLYAAPRRPASATPSADGRQPDPARLLAQLTPREQDVLRVLAEGVSTVEAAARLGVSPATVKSHVSHALTKLGARNRVEAVLMVQRALFCETGSLDYEPEQRAHP